MSWNVFLVVTLAGLGTWALRYVPILFMRRQPGPRLSRFLGATGPAAIAALAVASLLPELSVDLNVMVPLGAGCATVVLAYLLRRDIAIATLAGALAYGLVFAMMGAG